MKVEFHKVREVRWKLMSQRRRIMDCINALPRMRFVGDLCHLQKSIGVWNALFLLYSWEQQRVTRCPCDKQN